MIYRVFFAVLGAIVVTTSLLLAMEKVTSVFRERDTTKYFRITDILERPDPGRPERPASPRRLPAAPEAEVSLPAPRIPLEAPAAAPSLLSPPRAPDRGTRAAGDTGPDEPGN